LAEYWVFASEILSLAEIVLDACRARGWHVAIAESCTGGLVAAALTAVPGSNPAKSEMLGVPSATITAHGAVSAETTAAMAQGAIVRAAVDLAISITGVAGPGGGSAEKPVGLVIFAVARRGGDCRTHRHVFPGDRTAVREAALKVALGLLADAAQLE
jgi:nicotinamide-nucleotide amidase